MSGGTQASLVGAISEPAFGFRDGRVQTERGAKRVRSFPVGSKQLQGVSVGSSEHFTLPRVAPRLREVNAYLGWFGPASRAMQAMSAGTSVAMKVPGVDKLWSAAAERFVQGSTGGPDEQARSKSGSHIVAIAYDAAGPPAQRGARDRRGRLHLHRPHARLGRGARGRRSPEGNRRARPRRRLRPRRAGRGLRRGRDLRAGRGPASRRAARARSSRPAGRPADPDTDARAAGGGGWRPCCAARASPSLPV